MKNQRCITGTYSYITYMLQQPGYVGNISWVKILKTTGIYLLVNTPGGVRDGKQAGKCIL